MSILFIDSSYVSFQCFFRTKRWVLKKTQIDDDNTIEWHNHN